MIRDDQTRPARSRHPIIVLPQLGHTYYCQSRVGRIPALKETARRLPGDDRLLLDDASQARRSWFLSDEIADVIGRVDIDIPVMIRGPHSTTTESEVKQRQPAFR